MGKLFARGPHDISFLSQNSKGEKKAAHTRAIAMGLCLLMVTSGFGQMLQPAAREDEEESPVTASPQAQTGQEFVAVPDLADQLRKFDPGAVVEWDGRRLRITAKGQRFTLFLTSSDVVVNGVPQRISSPLRVYRGELFVPQDAVDLLAETLAKVTATPTSMPSPTVAPPTPSPTATPATPTPVTVATPTPTPLQSAPPSPIPTTTPTPPPPTPSPTPQEPMATARPATPRPSIAIEIRPSPRPTALPTKIVALQPSGNIFERLVHEREFINQCGLKPFPKGELERRAQRANVTTILLDPDEGVAANAGSEQRRQSHLTLELAMKLRAILEARGYKVELTREDPHYVSLAQKLERIRSSSADLLLSLRAGWNSSATVSGGRVFYPSPATDYSLGKALSANNVEYPIEQTYRPFAEKSKTFASVCAGALKNELPAENAGPLPAPLFLARRAPMPSITVLLGYLSNSGDRNRLLDESHQNQLVERLAEAIDQYKAAATRKSPATASGAGGRETP